MTKQLVVVLLIALFLAACGGSNTTVHTIDVSQLTIEQVRDRALVALSQPGKVFHSVGTAHFTSGGKDYDYKVEVWLDLERKLARREEYANGVMAADDGLRVYHDDRVASVHSGRFSDAFFAPAPPPPPPISTLALDYIRPLFEQDAKSVKLRSSSVDGQAAIVVDLVLPSGETGETTSEQLIFLDEQYLPIQIKDASSSSTMRFHNEFLPRDALAPDLLSVDAVRALVKTGAERMQEAVSAGFRPYWLGDPYQDLPLYDTNISTANGRQAFSITYEANEANLLAGTPSGPPYGLTITEFGPENYASWLQAAQASWWQKPGVQQTAVEVAGGEATIYSAAPQGRGPEPPVVAGQPTPTPSRTPTLNVKLVVKYVDAVVLVDANIGPTDPYATVEAMTKIAQDLRPFTP